MTIPAQPTGSDDPVLAMTVEDVCRLALDYETFRTKSAVELIARSGYRERWPSVTLELLNDALRRHPDWVEAWIQWSADKRVNSGWYIRRCDASTFDVGSLPAVEPRRFDDPAEACAVFLRHELASLADVGPLPE